MSFVAKISSWVLFYVAPSLDKLGWGVRGRREAIS